MLCERMGGFGQKTFIAEAKESITGILMGGENEDAYFEKERQWMTRRGVGATDVPVKKTTAGMEELHLGHSSQKNKRKSRGKKAS